MRIPRPTCMCMYAFLFTSNMHFQDCHTHFYGTYLTYFCQTKPKGVSSNVSTFFLSNRMSFSCLWQTKDFWRRNELFGKRSPMLMEMGILLMPSLGRCRREHTLLRLQVASLPHLTESHKKIKSRWCFCLNEFFGFWQLFHSFIHTYLN